MNLIASKEIFYRSPYPKELFCYSPAIVDSGNGSLTSSFDLGGPGIEKLGVSYCHGDYSGNVTFIFHSDDGGKSWRKTAELPLRHGRLFRSGKKLWILGDGSSMAISGSSDGGITWSKLSVLKDSQLFEQAHCAVEFMNGYVYALCEVRINSNDWPGIAPSVMRAKADSDLADPDNWSYSKPLKFDSIVSKTNSAGIPFYPAGPLDPKHLPDLRFCGNPGWLEGNFVKIRDKSHNLYSENSLYLWMRCHSGMTNLAAIIKYFETSDGTMTLGPVKTPAGSTLGIVPCPGGQMKFFILYDDVSALYWLVSSQTTDSMTRPELLPNERFGVPDNERNRLQLHFSKNLFDWCFAGMISGGRTQLDSCHYSAAAVSGDNLLILARSGDSEALSAHNGNLITFHQVHNFRKLIY